MWPFLFIGAPLLWVFLEQQPYYLGSISQRVQVPNKFEVSGSKNHETNRFWSQKPLIFVGNLDAGHSGPLIFGNSFRLADVHVFGSLVQAGTRVELNFNPGPKQSLWRCAPGQAADIHMKELRAYSQGEPTQTNWDY